MTAAAPLPVAAPGPPPVVLLHGLGLGGWAMAPLARRLRRAGFATLNLTYPSLGQPLEAIAGSWLPQRLRAQGIDAATPVHFVTHSMGGLVVRWYRRAHPEAPVGRVVMLAPPNGGSEIVDRVRGWPILRWLWRHNGVRLGTGPAELPGQAGPWLPGGGELGIIAGRRGLNPLFSAWLGGPNDGRVAVARTQLAGMSDFLVMAHTHTWLQWQPDVAAAVVAFLRSGRFTRAVATAG